MGHGPFPIQRPTRLVDNTAMSRSPNRERLMMSSPSDLRQWIEGTLTLPMSTTGMFLTSKISQNGDYEDGRLTGPLTDPGAVDPST